MRPFHVDCPVTKKRVCFCHKHKSIRSIVNNKGMLSTSYRRMAYETQLYYEGFPDQILERVHEKLKFERQRLIEAKSAAHINTYEKFIEYAEEDDIVYGREEPAAQVPQNQGQQAPIEPDNKKRVAK